VAIKKPFETYSLAKEAQDWGGEISDSTTGYPGVRKSMQKLYALFYESSLREERCGPTLSMTVHHRGKPNERRHDGRLHAKKILSQRKVQVKRGVL